MDLPSHCEPEDFPCWDCFGPHQRTFVSQQTLDLATSALEFRLRQRPVDYAKVSDGYHLLKDLLNTRWCGMVRDPPGMDPYTGGDTYVSESATEDLSSGRDLLRKLGLVKKVERRL